MRDSAHALRDAAYLFLTFAAVIAVGGAFLQPWLPPPVPGGPELNRYVPIVDSSARLYSLQDAAGRLIGWESRNLSTPATLHGVAYALPSNIARAILLRYGQRTTQSLDRMMTEFSDVRLMISRQRLLGTDGQMEFTELFHVRDESGHYLVGFYDERSNTELVFDPYLQLYSRELALGSRWSSQGKANRLFDYAYEGEVTAQGSRENALGRFDDCLQIRTRYVLRATPFVDRTTVEWLCADAGLVESEVLDASGALVRRSLPLTSAAEIPPPRLLDAARRDVLPAHPEQWQLWPVAKADLGGAGFTIRPAWLPLDPPLVLLAAAYNSDLLAFSADGIFGQPVWRFQAGGTIFGQPAFDPQRGRIYFGASDKRLYALDGRGLFLWSFLTGDNVATRPLVVNDLVIFGSEDGNVYALNADTGALRWRAAAGAAVASSPARASDQHIVIGTDDGQVLAYAIEDGELLWDFDAEGPVEADIVIAEDKALVTVSTGTLIALNAQTGTEVWRYNVGGAMRQPPAVGSSLAVALSRPGRLTALSLTDGRQLWNSASQRYSSAPAIIGEYILVIDNDGQFHLLDLQGQRLLHLEEHIAPAGAGQRYNFVYGPEVGGGAIWAIDASNTLWRLGP
jgi:outer membrane protein assembly factor BamB